MTRSPKTSSKAAIQFFAVYAVALFCIKFPMIFLRQSVGATK